MAIIHYQFETIETCILINNIKALMDKNKKEIRTKLPKIYSKDLLETIFMHPYTKIDFLIDNLNLHRETASKYLKAIEDMGILKSIKLGRNKYFIHMELLTILKK